MAAAQRAIRSRSSTGRPKRIANTSGGSGSAKAATNSHAPPASAMPSASRSAMARVAGRSCSTFFGVNAVDSTARRWRCSSPWRLNSGATCTAVSGDRPLATMSSAKERGESRRSVSVARLASHPSTTAMGVPARSIPWAHQCWRAQRWSSAPQSPKNSPTSSWAGPASRPSPRQSNQRGAHCLRTTWSRSRFLVAVVGRLAPPSTMWTHDITDVMPPFGEAARRQALGGHDPQHHAECLSGRRGGGFRVVTFGLVGPLLGEDGGLDGLVVAARGEHHEDRVHERLGEAGRPPGR